MKSMRKIAIMHCKYKFLVWMEKRLGLADRPVGLRLALVTLYERYEVPLFIVENGFGAIDILKEDHTCDDDYRIAYLKEHITEMKKAVEIDGVDLMGYTPWGCIDLVSFTTGELKKRYGFIYVVKMMTEPEAERDIREIHFGWYRSDSDKWRRTYCSI